MYEICTCSMESMHAKMNKIVTATIAICTIKDSYIAGCTFLLMKFVDNYAFFQTSR